MQKKQDRIRQFVEHSEEQERKMKAMQKKQEAVRYWLSVVLKIYRFWFSLVWIATPEDNTYHHSEDQK